jgi:hypothetical protein
LEQGRALGEVRSRARDRVHHLRQGVHLLGQGIELGIGGGVLLFNGGHGGGDLGLDHGRILSGRQIKSLGTPIEPKDGNYGGNSKIATNCDRILGLVTGLGPGRDN